MSSLLSARTVGRLFRAAACSCGLALVLSGAMCHAQFGGGGFGGGGGGFGGGGGGFGGGGGGFGGGGQGGGGQGGGTQGTGPFSGVAIDAEGVLRRVAATPADMELIRARAEQAEVKLGRDLARPSQLRKVSLTRLIKAVDQAVAAGHGPDEAMQRLAGLTRIRYVFYYPETKDIVLAGPAEGWVETPLGRVMGLETGAPILELQDLAVALRTMAQPQAEQPLVYCSIDPTQEGLARTQQFLSQLGRYNPGDTQMIVEGLEQSMGRQRVSIGGIPATTHFAQVMVEADYRMKLIGIGLEEPPVRIASFVSLVRPAALASNALVRWWFVPDYQRVKVTEDGFAAEFVGRGVKLVGEDEVVDAQGGRTSGGSQGGASKRFTRGFTDKFGELAEVSPVYAQLRNCVDLLVAAAFIKQYDLLQQADLELGALGDEQAYSVEKHPAPQEVATAVNAIWKGNTLMTPFGGGVEIRPQQALEPANKLADDGSAAKMRDSIDLSELPADAWWWD